MNTRPKITEVNVLLFIFVTLYLAFQFGVAFFAAALSSIYGQEYYTNFFTENVTVITLIIQIGIILIPVLIFALVRKLKFKSVFRLNNPGFLPMLIILTASVPAYFVAVMLNNIGAYLLQFIGEIPTSAIPAPGNLNELIISLLVFAVTPGIVEEMMHRGVILSAYERRGSQRAIIITAIIFGLFHFDLSNLIGPIFLGILIGNYVLRTNSIFAGMFAHFLNNAIATMLQYFAGKLPIQQGTTNLEPDQLIIIIIIGVVSAAILAGLILLFNYVTRRKYKPIPAISTVRKDISSVISHWPIIITLLLYILMGGMFIFGMIAS